MDGIPFHPYYTLKDIVGVGLFLTLFAIVVFFVPTFGGLFLEAPNFEPANPIVHARCTSRRSGTSRLTTRSCARFRTRSSARCSWRCRWWLFLFLPWLDRAQEQVDPLSRPGRRRCCWACSSSRSCVLMWLGLKPADGIYVLLARIFTVLYFAFFILLPFVSKAEATARFPSE